MKAGRAVLAAGALILVGLLGFGSTFVRSDLAVADGPFASLPPMPSVDGVSITVIPTARVVTQHGFSVRGAPIADPLVSAMVAVLVEHPHGPLLIDAGMSAGARAHVSTVPLLMQAVVDLQVSQSVAEGLRSEGVRPADLRGVLLTHGHWDHVSGLEDLPGVPVWMTAEERAYVEHDSAGLLYRQIHEASPILVQELVFDQGAYGPFSRHHDVYGDGSVVAVPMPGHSPGSVGVFVNLPDGRRLLFIGDTAWASEGVAWPAEKPWVTRRMVDDDAGGVREQLVLLHRLAEAHPELTVVPAHDERVHQGLR